MTTSGPGQPLYVLRAGLEPVFERLIRGPAGTLPDLLEGWPCTDILIHRSEARLRFGAGPDRVEVRLRHPAAAAPDAPRSAHFAVERAGATGAGDAVDLRLVQALLARLAETDRTDPWTPLGAADPVAHDRPRDDAALVSALPFCASALLVGSWALLLRRRARLAAEEGRGRPGARPDPPAPCAAPPGGGTSGWLLAGLTAALALLLALPPLTRLAEHTLGGFDLGVYAHAFWNALHGNGFYNTPEGLDHLGSHASPILYLLLPAYALWPHPSTLLVLNALALAAALPPAVWLAERRLGRGPGLAFAALLFLHPALGGLSLGLREETLALPLWTWALWALDARRPRAFAAFLALALACKESAGVVAVFVGAHAWLEGRGAKLALATAALGAIVLWLGAVVVVPAFGGDLQADTLFRYGHLGASGWQIALSPFLRPAAFWGALGSPASLAYLVRLLAPFAFLPLLAPRALVLVVPIVLQNLLTAEPAQRTLAFYYEAQALPGLLLAAVEGAARLRRAVAGAAPGAGPARALLPGVAVLAALTAVAGQACYGARAWEAVENPTYAEEVAVLAAVPAGVPLAAPPHLMPHLAERAVAGYVDRGNEAAALDDARYDVVVVPLRTGADPGSGIPLPVAQAAGRRELLRTRSYLVLERPEPSGSTGAPEPQGRPDVLP